ncbi:MAG: sensor histidine kinase [Planctomycetota bacterium]
MDSTGAGGAADELQSHIAILEAKMASLYGQVRQAQQLASMGTAAATLAHEVNNLLTPIVNYTDQAMRSGNEALQRKALGVAWKNSQMLVAMSERILRISAPDARELRDVSIHRAAEEAADSLCRDLSKDGIAFCNEVDPALTVRTDALSLQQVFFNLFLNARDVLASRHGSRLKVTAQRVDDNVVISVADNGEGIPDDVLPLVFEPLKSSKTNAEGARGRCKGLGLALCRNLVSEMRGEISVSSAVDQGTTFSIKLPCS